jgi:hypothetical protein
VRAFGVSDDALQAYGSGRVEAGSEESVAQALRRSAYPRLRAHAVTTELSRFQAAKARKPSGLGFSIYSDESWVVGALFRVEIFVPGRESAICIARVAWVDAAGRTDAHYDVGLDVLEVSGDGLTLVFGAFMPEGEEPEPTPAVGS